jgi:cytochrome P450
VYTPYVMGRLEEMYENPLKFNPERWFQPRNLKKTPFEYPVFQAGPRTCLGQHMAFFESKLLTAMILQKFLVRVKPGMVASPAESLTMPISGGLPVTIHRRSKFFTATATTAQPEPTAKL